MNSGLEQALIVLTYTTIIMLVIISAFLVKLLVDFSNLIKSKHDLVLLLNHELEPTLKELKKPLIISILLQNQLISKLVQ